MKKETPRSKPKRGVSVSGASEDPKAQLEGFLDKYDPKIATLGRRAFALMRKRLPGAVELVYDNYNALAVGFSEVDKVAKIPLSIALYPRWVTLFFMHGGALPDPAGKLEGKAPKVRSIRIEDTKRLAVVFADEDIDQLFAAAVMHVGWTLQATAKGRIVIKSISAKQRPRRP
jgi:hypothetical protein